MICDLLNPSDTFLDLREDPIKGPTVAGITELEIVTVAEGMKLLQQGNRNRSQESTAANSVSSRSHAVLQLIVEQREVSPGTKEVRKLAKLSMIDLAGSERASKSHVSVHLSLLLTNCMPQQA